MHNMGQIIFNGKSSLDFGIVVERVPNMNRPARKFDKFSVPGRSGDIIQQYDAWENITVSYDIWFTNNHYKDLYAPAKAREISAWLYGADGYARIEDSFEPDYYRLGYFEGPLDIELMLLKFGRCTITFNCRPERYLKTGDIWQQHSSTFVITNPTHFDAKPLIKVYGPFEWGLISVQGNTLIVENVNDYMIIDSDSMDCYRLESENMNSHVQGQFPILKPGRYSVTLSNTIEKVEIKPNFWTL